ncbi:LexA family transcriptional regulator [Pseudomonas sp. 7SR1]|uniref:LexA family transcriptional regulator n=1 Tax=Pseudomonas sp. 7SR1 TaxID=1881017 RepID=UPI0009538FAA|nr:helix-turn-helix transcriptional regulator [Pseudomonas sp. 7SR1]ROO41328.1 transcriptional regulator [Pseudomonas sp. 7SR1]SIS14477.1 Phage repressor protein C, contains Cro/C1-type HTH and peptisase s24 domains [Pseudomonas sp. 7SR1]
MKKISSGDRFRALLKEANIRSADFAKLYGVKSQHVNNWFNRGIPPGRIHGIAGLLTVSPQWLANGEGPQTPLGLGPGTTYDAAENQGVYSVPEATDIELPYYKEAPIAPGAIKTHVIEIPGQTTRLPRSHLESLEINPSDAICTTMVGDSMAERIEDGSTLAIDRGLTQIVDGQIYALEHDGMLRIKYLHRIPGNRLRLRSHNSVAYPDEVFSTEQIEAQNIRVIGWVFWWSTLNKQRPPVCD